MGIYLIKFWGNDTNLIKEEKVEMLESQIIPYSQEIISKDNNIIRATYEIYTSAQ